MSFLKRICTYYEAILVKGQSCLVSRRRFCGIFQLQVSCGYVSSLAVPLRHQDPRQTPYTGSKQGRPYPSCPRPGMERLLRLKGFLIKYNFGYVIQFLTSMAFSLVPQEKGGSKWYGTPVSHH